MTTRRVYTTEIHASNLRIMLEKDEPCSHCPAGKDFDCESEGSAKAMQKQWKNDPCPVCREFSRIERGCPCRTLGAKETIKQAIETLKAYPKETP